MAPAPMSVTVPMYRARMSHASSHSDADERSSADLFDHDPILPPDPLDDAGNVREVLHDREYRVRAFRLAADRVLLRGASAGVQRVGTVVQMPELMSDAMTDAEAPCGAAENSARSLLLSTCSNQVSCATKVSFAQAVARWPNTLPTGLPAALSDTAAASSKFGWPAISRNSSPPT